jgi:prophage DNA circulation protein
MSIKSEEQTLTAMISDICKLILQMVSAKGSQAAELRRLVGLVNVDGLQYLADNVFGTNLYNCFVVARTLPITADLVASVRDQITALTPVGPLTTMVYDSAIQYCLTTECILITGTTFKSRDDVQQTMSRITAAFNLARDNAAERMDSATYQNLTYLAGSIVNYLSATALTLPRLVQFNLNTSWPALSLANLIYQDASRWEELVDENKVVHPAFMPRAIVGLSA